MTTSREWTPVTKANPCPACGAPDWCAWSKAGMLKCERSLDTPAGFKRVKKKDGGAVFAPMHDSGPPPKKKARTPVRAAGGRSENTPSYNADALQATFRGGMTVERMARLATHLGVVDAALDQIEVGWATGADLKSIGAWGKNWTRGDLDSGAYSFPERDGADKIVGFSFRLPNGRKGAPKGAKRGLIIPRNLLANAGTVLMVEGPTDVAACVSLGIPAVGRPSNAGGADFLAQCDAIKNRDVLVVGERDEKPDRKWPGKTGAIKVAGLLASTRHRCVSWSLPPDGHKDVRDWIKPRLAEGGDGGPSSSDIVAARDELMAALLTSKVPVEPSDESGNAIETCSQSEQLVRLALDRYRFGMTTDNQAFAVRNDGPNIAMLLRGSQDVLRASIARDFRRECGRTPKASSLSDAFTVLQGEARETVPEEVHLRIAPYDAGVVIDLGTTDGRVVHATGSGWRILDKSPVLFRRTALSGALPVPTREGRLEDLRSVLNVTPEAWPLVLGWLIAAYLPEIPHPILLLGGEHGTGKSTASRFLVGLFDPSSAPTRSCPRDAEGWSLAASGSWGVVLDNVSVIPDWLSDALCKAVTGDGWIRRTLYTTADLTVLRFRRVMALTSIDAGSLRGDLGDRILLLDLELIEKEGRRSETELDAAYARLRPGIFGAVLDLLVRVLAELPLVKLNSMPRMADFARVLAAMDRELSTKALDTYLGQTGRIAESVLESDPVGAAIFFRFKSNATFLGTAEELLRELTPSESAPGQKWPSTGTAFARKLRRLAPSLREVGIEVVVPDKTDKTRRYTVRGNAQTAPMLEGGNSTSPVTGQIRAFGPTPRPEGPVERPRENRSQDDGERDSGRSGVQGIDPDHFHALGGGHFP